MSDDFIFKTEQDMKPKEKRLCLYCRGAGTGLMAGRAKNRIMCAECRGYGYQYYSQYIGMDFALGPSETVTFVRGKSAWHIIDEVAGGK